MVLLKNDLIQSGVYSSKVEFITVTIDPYRDAEDVMTHYANAFDAYDDENWHFFIGDFTTTEKHLQIHFNFYITTLEMVSILTHFYLFSR